MHLPPVPGHLAGRGATVSPTFLVRRRTRQFAAFRYDGPGDDLAAFLDMYGGPGLLEPVGADDEPWEAPDWPMRLWDQYLGQWCTVKIGYFIIVFGEPRPGTVRLQTLSPERFAEQYEAV